MKAIKFRAWIRYQKEIKEVYSLDFINKKAYIEMNKSVPFGYVNFDGCELMQFTGLHDNNGKEIYEGDIIKAKCSRGVIIFEDGCFIIKWIRDKDFFNNVLSRHADCITIVGNIYETPLLVE